MDEIEIYVSATCHGQFLDELGLEPQIQFADDDDAWVERALNQWDDPTL